MEGHHHHGLKVAEAKLVVHIHPSKTKIVSDAIKREISSQLFKFTESFEGVMLAYDVIEIESKTAKILSSLFPYLGVTLRANLLLFHPKPNMYLEGEVVKVSPGSIHLVVLGFASAVITEADIRDEFKFKIRGDEAVFRSRSDKRHAIEAKTMIRFLVKSFDEEVIHICGSLAPANTGSIKWLDRSLEKSPSGNRGSTKRRDSEGKGDSTDNGALSVESHVVKKSKKRKHEQSLSVDNHGV